MNDFTIKRNDTRSAIKATLLDANAAPVNLAGASVRFIMVGRDKKPKIARAAEITDAAGGTVRFVFDNTETTVGGAYNGEFEVTYADGGVETFPNNDVIKIWIESDLG